MKNLTDSGNSFGLKLKTCCQSMFMYVTQHSLTFLYKWQRYILSSNTNCYLSDYFNPSSPNGVGCKKHTDNKLQIVSVLHNLNIQSCIKGFWWYSISVLGHLGSCVGTEKRIWTDYEQFLSAVFSCFQGQQMLIL